MHCNWFLGTVTNSRPSLVAQMVKKLPAMQETRVWSLGQEDPLEKKMATPTSILKCLAPLHSDANQTKTSVFGAEEGLSQGQERRWVTSCPTNPKLPKGLQESILKPKWERGLVGCCRLLVLKSFVLAAFHLRSGHSVLINLQQDECYSLICNFLSLNGWKTLHL